MDVRELPSCEALSHLPNGVTTSQQGLLTPAMHFRIHEPGVITLMSWQLVTVQRALSISVVPSFT